MRTIKLLGFLLTYPDQDHTKVVEDAAGILESEKWISQQTIERLLDALQAFRSRSILDIQEEYVALFDRTPSLSLHLFEHIHGDSRDRGQAMVDLMKVYEDAGLFIDHDEMPDYLPLFAEYLSTLPTEEASDNLGSVVNILSSIAERLKNRDSFYASIFDALIETAARQPDKEAVVKFLESASGAAPSFQELDTAWEEQFAFDNQSLEGGQGTGDCPKIRDMLDRMNDITNQERA